MGDTYAPSALPRVLTSSPSVFTMRSSLLWLITLQPDTRRMRPSRARVSFSRRSAASILSRALSSSSAGSKAFTSL